MTVFRRAKMASLMVAAMLPASSALATPAGPDADAWASAVERQMTDDERFSLIHSFMPMPLEGFVSPEQRAKWPSDVVVGAGYVPGIARLGVPSLRETDASLGVTNPFEVRAGDSATALPAGIALGATFNPRLAYASGKLVGTEARAKGFNVLLGGGINLMRDPRNGRNFEYISEDPLLSGLMGAQSVRGAQDAGVISTVKHFAINSYETNRHRSDSIIDPIALRESDLLAFEIAIEQGQPGSVMCGYNLVNGAKACGSDWLLNTVLKMDWAYKGWVMSDWGAVSYLDFAAKGLDQQSGEELDQQVWLNGPLRKALADGAFPRARLSDMVRRVLRSMKAVGLTDPVLPPKPDMAAHAADALEVARQGIVLLKNDGALPLAAGAGKIVLIGGNAHIGVLSGGGSSQVLPPKGWAASIPVGGGTGDTASWRIQRWFASSPQEALQKALPGAAVAYDPGVHVADAVLAARRADVAIVFVSKFELEGYDSADLALPAGQDQIVSAVAAANPNTIVVMETGNPVAMPWKDQVKAIIAAWYPGQEGGTAIAEILTGAVNPSGRLPITFPASLAQLPRPEIEGYGSAPEVPVRATMIEGADVGYRWFARHDLKPLYAFGHGLSYSTFAYSHLRLSGGKTVTARFTVHNTGTRKGADVPQLYLRSRDGQAMPRLIGFERVDLNPGESRTVSITIDQRLLGRFDGPANRWTVDGGSYAIALSRAADAPVETATMRLTRRWLER